MDIPQLGGSEKGSTRIHWLPQAKRSEGLLLNMPAKSTPCSLHYLFKAWSSYPWSFPYFLKFPSVQRWGHNPKRQKHLSRSFQVSQRPGGWRYLHFAKYVIALARSQLDRMDQGTPKLRLNPTPTKHCHVVTRNSLQLCLTRRKIPQHHHIPKIQVAREPLCPLTLSNTLLSQIQLHQAKDHPMQRAPSQANTGP